MTRKSQSGLSLIGVLFVGAVLGFLVILGLKLVPVMTEYYGVKRSINAVASEADPQNASVPQLRNAFAKRASIDDVTSVAASDLDITKEDGRIDWAALPVVIEILGINDIEAFLDGPVERSVRIRSFLRSRVVRAQIVVGVNRYETTEASPLSGGDGSIMGRNAFQRPRDEALAMLDKIVKIYKGKE